MKIKINNSQILKTNFSLKEIADRIKNHCIALNDDDNIVNWKEVWSVVIVK